MLQVQQHSQFQIVLRDFRFEYGTLYYNSLEGMMPDEMVDLGAKPPVPPLIQQAPLQVTQVTPKGESLDPKSMIVRWVLGQEASTVILIAILICGGYATWWHITVGAPTAKKESTDVFERISKENNDTNRQVTEKFTAAIKEAAAEHARAVDKMQMSFERALDRVDRRPSAKD